MRRLAALLLVVSLGVAACSDDSEPSASASSDPPIATSSTTTSTTEAPSTPEEEVEAAYLRMWDVYADAMRRLDGSRYPDVFSGAALDLRNRELESLREANTPARMEVEHDYEIVLLAGDRAQVFDTYRNHSVTVDPKTGEPTEPDPNNVLKHQYDFVKVNGRWIVVDVREF